MSTKKMFRVYEQCKESFFTQLPYIVKSDLEVEKIRRLFMECEGEMILNALKILGGDK